MDVDPFVGTSIGVSAVLLATALRLRARWRIDAAQARDEREQAENTLRAALAELPPDTQASVTWPPVSFTPCISYAEIRQRIHAQGPIARDFSLMSRSLWDRVAARFADAGTLVANLGFLAHATIGDNAGQVADAAKHIAQSSDAWPSDFLERSQVERILNDARASSPRMVVETVNATLRLLLERTHSASATRPRRSWFETLVYVGTETRIAATFDDQLPHVPLVEACRTIARLANASADPGRHFSARKEDKGYVLVLRAATLRDLNALELCLGEGTGAWEAEHQRTNYAHGQFELNDIPPDELDATIERVLRTFPDRALSNPAIHAPGDSCTVRFSVGSLSGKRCSPNSRSCSRIRTVWDPSAFRRLG